MPGEPLWRARLFGRFRNIRSGKQEGIDDFVKEFPPLLLLPGLNHATALAVGIPKFPEEGPAEVVKTAVEPVGKDDTETVVVELQPSVSILAHSLEKLMGAHEDNQAVQFLQNLLDFHAGLLSFLGFLPPKDSH